jgi:manganese/zinc/iron transport system substrate-binding protein
VWFDATLWRATVDPVVEQLSELDPEGAEEYERRGEDYGREIDELHSFVEAEISSIPEERRVLVTAHDAFRYFGRQYGMEVGACRASAPRPRPGPGTCGSSRTYLAENEIPAIFVESSVPRPQRRGRSAGLPRQGLGSSK